MYTSLSLSLYIYIYMYTHIRIHTHTRRQPRAFRAPRSWQPLTAGHGAEGAHHYLYEEFTGLRGWLRIAGWLRLGWLKIPGWLRLGWLRIT